MNARATLKKFRLEKTFDYLYKDPDKNLKKLVNWADKLGGKMCPSRLG